MGGLIYPESVMASDATKLGKTIGRRKEQRAEEKWIQLAPHVSPWRPRRILDIGAGFGLIDIHLAKLPSVEVIHLLDGDGSGEFRSSYREDTKAWCDVRLAVDMVRANVKPWVEVRGFFDHRLDELLVQEPYDLVISCRSWCHHYPVSTYAAMVRDHLLAPGGHVVTDVRHRTEGVEQMIAAGFRVKGRVEDSSHKCVRLIFERG